jgi:hypothetical protein
VLVSALFALWFTNSLVGANTGEIERLVRQCATKSSSQGSKDCARLRAFVLKPADQEFLATLALKDKDPRVCRLAASTLTDQELLAKVVVESQAPRARLEAVAKLTDKAALAKVAVQAALAKMAVEDKYLQARLDAVGKLTDQTALAKLALADGDGEVSVAALGKLTDQAALTEIAVESKSNGLRRFAVGKLTDQAALGRIAVDDKDWRVRSTAAVRLTNQPLLAKIAAEDKDAHVRIAAARNLTDQPLLAKIAETQVDRFVRATAVAAMDPSNPALRRQAGDLKGGISSDVVSSIARVKLSVQEPRIRSRFPRIAFQAAVSDVSRSYRDVPRYGQPEPFGAAGSIDGEFVSFVLSQDGEILAKMRWASAFPAETTAASLSSFQPAEVHSDELLTDLLHNAVITQDDLAELSVSEIPEARKAAVQNLTSQAVLAKSATEDQLAQIRSAAVVKLTDQTALAKVAVGDKDFAIRLEAVAKLTDQAVLAKIAAEDKDLSVRRDAQRRLAWLRQNVK